MALKNESVSKTCHWVSGKMSTTCHWDKGRMSTICHSKSESVHNLSLKQRECPKLVTENMRLQNKLKQDSSNAAVGMNQVSNYLATKSWNTWNLLIDLILGSLIFSVTSFGHSHRFSDKLWTLSLFEWQIVDILPLSQWQVVDILPITQWQVVDTLAFFSAINCEDFEIKAKIRVENQLFHTFHHAHRIPEAFLHDICQNSFSCDSPFKIVCNLTPVEARLSWVMV